MVSTSVSRERDALLIYSPKHASVQSGSYRIFGEPVYYQRAFPHGELNMQHEGRFRGTAVPPKSNRDQPNNVERMYSKVRSQMENYITLGTAVTAYKSKERTTTSSLTNNNTSFESIMNTAADFLHYLIDEWNLRNTTASSVIQRSVSFEGGKYPYSEDNAAVGNDTISNDDYPETQEVKEANDGLNFHDIPFHTQKSLFISHPHYDEDVEMHEPKHVRLIHANKMRGRVKDRDKVYKETVLERKVKAEPPNDADELEYIEALGTVACNDDNRKVTNKVCATLGSLDDESLNRRIDERICRAFQMLRTIVCPQTSTLPQLLGRYKYGREGKKTKVVRHRVMTPRSTPIKMRNRVTTESALHSWTAHHGRRKQYRSRHPTTKATEEMEQ